LVVFEGKSVGTNFSFDWRMRPRDRSDEEKQKVVLRTVSWADDSHVRRIQDASTIARACDLLPEEASSEAKASHLM
jgi:hypothetical protein